MFIINLEARMKNKNWWIQIISGAVLICAYFGLDLTKYIGKDWANLVGIIFSILTLIGITVDNSTKGLSDQVISNTTVQAVKAAETKETIKTEDSTTGINGVITENSQSGSDNASASASDKESETNSNIDNSVINSSNDNAAPVIDPIAIQAENEQLKATLNQIQSVVTDNITTPSNS